uniref:Uncharacterized protein n=1 Tax=Timema shepardi TaxID=629360 RepID=A0A7R9AXI3_TIMSH|nr:unnamed protein product [Timema shepardi]
MIQRIDGIFDVGETGYKLLSSVLRPESCPSGGSDSFVWLRGTSIVSGRPRIESRSDSRLKTPLSQLCQLESGGQSSCFGVEVCVVAHRGCRRNGYAPFAAAMFKVERPVETMAT